MALEKLFQGLIPVHYYQLKVGIEDTQMHQNMRLLVLFSDIKILMFVRPLFSYIYSLFFVFITFISLFFLFDTKANKSD